MALNQGVTMEVSQTSAGKSSDEATITAAVAKDGAKVNIEVTSLENSMFQLDGQGFKPYETLNFISNSYNEVIHGQIQADKDGNLLPMGLLPAVIGKSGGVCHIDILREEGSIHIKLPWGTEALKDH